MEAFLLRVIALREREYHELKEYPWFVDCTRQEAERYLTNLIQRRIKVFLVRPTNSNLFDVPYTVSLNNVRHEVEHIQIWRLAENDEPYHFSVKLNRLGELKYRTIVDLIDDLLAKGILIEPRFTQK